VSPWWSRRFLRSLPLPARWVPYLSLPAARVLLAVSYLSTLSLLRHFLRTTTAMAKKKITGAELTARAKANGYQRGAHRDKDSLRDQNKHVDKVKMDQNAALDRYVL
jgi:hypothetical protein